MIVMGLHDINHVSACFWRIYAIVPRIIYVMMQVVSGAFTQPVRQGMCL